VTPCGVWLAGAAGQVPEFCGGGIAFRFLFFLFLCLFYFELLIGVEIRLQADILKSVCGV
jgi:hypothetical protein